MGGRGSDNFQCTTTGLDHVSATQLVLSKCVRSGVLSGSNHSGGGGWTVARVNGHHSAAAMCGGGSDVERQVRLRLYGAADPGKTMETGSLPSPSFLHLPGLAGANRVRQLLVLGN